MTKKVGILKLIVLIVVFFLVLSVCVSSVFAIRGYKYFNKNGFNNLKTVTEQSFPSAEIKGLKIDAASSDILLQYGTDADIKVEFKSSNSSKTVDISKTADGILTVSQDGNTGFFLFNLCIMQIVVTVPNGFETTADVVVHSGNFESNVNVTALDISQSSGNTVMNGNCNGTVKAETTSGNINITGNAETLDLKTTSGNITTSGNAKSAAVKATSGNIKCENAFESLAIKVTSGNVTAAADSKSLDITANSTSGNVKLIFDNVSGYKLDAEIGSGMINDAVKGKTYHDDIDYTVGDGKLSVTTAVTSGNMKIVNK